MSTNDLAAVRVEKERLRPLKRNIERFIASTYPRGLPPLERLYEDFREAVERIGGRVEPLRDESGEPFCTDLGNEILVAYYGDGVLRSAVNGLHPNEPFGVLQERFNIERCRRDPAWMKQWRFASVLVADPDGYMLQKWTEQSLPSDPFEALKRYALGWERPDSWLVEGDFGSPDPSVENRALHAFLKQTAGALTYEARHGMALEQTIIWQMRPELRWRESAPTWHSPQLRAIAELAHIKMRHVHPEDPWIRRSGNAKSVFVAPGVEDARAWARRAAIKNFNARVMGADVFSALSSHGMVSIVDSPMFYAADISRMKLRGATVGEVLDMAAKSIGEVAGYYRLTDSALGYVARDAKLWRICRSAAKQVNYAVIDEYRAVSDLEQRPVSELRQRASDAFVYHWTSRALFWATCWAGMGRRALELPTRPAPWDFQYQGAILEKVVERRLSDLLDQIDIRTTPVSDLVFINTASDDAVAARSLGRYRNADLAALQGGPVAQL